MYIMSGNSYARMVCKKDQWKQATESWFKNNSQLTFNTHRSFRSGAERNGRTLYTHTLPKNETELFL